MSHQYTRYSIEKFDKKEGSKGPTISPTPTQGRQDALFHWQGLSLLDMQSVHKPVRECEHREERQACDPEGGKEARTPLTDLFNPSLRRRSKVDVEQFYFTMKMTPLNL